MRIDQIERSMLVIPGSVSRALLALPDDAELTDEVKTMARHEARRILCEELGIEWPKPGRKVDHRMPLSDRQISHMGRKMVNGMSRDEAYQSALNMVAPKPRKGCSNE